MTFKDHFSDLSAVYRLFRPTYPPDLFAELARISPSRTLAWDCATGSGQSATGLAEHFDEVVGTDASASQLAEAARHDKVVYRVEHAEDSSFRDASVDLICVAQALHWFDLDAFEKEVARVLRKDGVLAVWSYAILRSTSEIDAVIDSLYNSILGDYWPPERRLVERGYDSVDFAMTQVAIPDFAMSANWTKAELLGYLSTWSAGKRYEQRCGENAVDKIRDAMDAAWAGVGERVHVEWPLSVKAWRKTD